MPEPTPDAQTQAQVAQPAQPDAPYAAPEGGGLNLPLLLGLLLILGLVAASNVWLRRRAERESRDRSPDQ